MLRIYEERISVPVVSGHADLREHLAQHVTSGLKPGLFPIRLVISETTDTEYICELGVIEGLDDELLNQAHSIFEFHRRQLDDTNTFNTVLMIPTGIGCTIGGHAGDANPVARLLAGVSDTLLTHPNVVNASDIIDLPENGLYIEGSVLTRLMMGSVGLQPVRSNRVLVAIDEHPNPSFTDVAINSVSAARASYGMANPGVVGLDPPVRVESKWAESGRAMGEITELEGLFDLIRERSDSFDALALSTQIKVPKEYHVQYYEERGGMVNPWGGVEAMFTHAVSLLFDIPTAHSPMFESNEIANLELGRVDPRMAAEEISTGFLMCVLKGLQRSPRMVENPPEDADGVITVANVSCLVIPDGVVGLPTLAALEQGIPVIAVRDNENIMKNRLEDLPWAPGQLHMVESYLEAAGVIVALREGVDPASVRRPLADTSYEIRHG